MKESPSDLSNDMSLQRYEYPDPETSRAPVRRSMLTMNHRFGIPNECVALVGLSKAQDIRPMDSMLVWPSPRRSRCEFEIRGDFALLGSTRQPGPLLADSFTRRRQTAIGTTRTALLNTECGIWYQMGPRSAFFVLPI